MIRNIDIDSLPCLCYGSPTCRKIAYILYPQSLYEGWVEETAQRYGTAVVAITVEDWDDALTPWPAPGIPAGSPDFKGLAPQFLKRLTDRMIPEAEKAIGLTDVPERTLVGVSLSGLFTLWQWMECRVFRNIASLSGSFWYCGFMEWFAGRELPRDTGKAFFLLGRQEPHSPVKAFDSVGENTLRIVKIMQDAGIDTAFEWVPGNHYYDPAGRLDLVFRRLFA